MYKNDCSVEKLLIFFFYLVHYFCKKNYDQRENWILLFLNGKSLKSDFNLLLEKKVQFNYCPDHIFQIFLFVLISVSTKIDL